MGEQTMETQKKVSLTKKDLNKAYWTFETYAQACCSYERLQAPGFFSGMRNIIDKLYDDDPEQKPIKSWRCHANTLYANWLNYYVYQSTPYDWTKKVTN